MSKSPSAPLCLETPLRAGLESAVCKHHVIGTECWEVGVRQQELSRLHLQGTQHTQLSAQDLGQGPCEGQYLPSPQPLPQCLVLPSAHSQRRS